MTSNALAEVAVIGIDIGKNTFHAIGLNQRGAIVLRQKWSRRQLADRLANLPPCLIGMEASELPILLAGRMDTLSPRMSRIWRRSARNYPAQSRPVDVCQCACRRARSVDRVLQETPAVPRIAAMSA